MITSDLKWTDHTNYVIKKAKKRLWHLRRLANMGASQDTLLERFQLVIRSTLEQAVPAYNAALTSTNIQDIEQVQKLAFKIILRGKYKNYEHALFILGEQTLEERRKNLTLKWAKKNLKHPILKNYFVKNNNGTRS